jgi:hypothetical protein
MLAAFARAIIAIGIVGFVGSWIVPDARGESGFGQGNWGGSSVSVGRSTFYANGLVSNQVGRTSFFNNGLVGRQYGNLTLYNNGLVAGRAGTTTYFSNLAVGVPARSSSTGVMVYGGGFPYPQGPGPYPFGLPQPPMGGATPWSTKPWSQTPWQRR